VWLWSLELLPPPDAPAAAAAAAAPSLMLVRLSTKSSSKSDQRRQQDWISKCLQGGRVHPLAACGASPPAGEASGSDGYGRGRAGTHSATKPW
jgi:hypothetical protein